VKGQSTGAAVSGPAADVTALLQAWGEGDTAARDQLLPVVYAELHRRAGAFLRRERLGHTLQPTALVHEAFMRLSEQSGIEWRDRRHFYGFASRVMRQVLVDHARKLATTKRGKNPIHFSIDDVQIPVEQRAEAILVLNDVLGRLERMDEQQAQVVEMRFFGGMNNAEIAESLDISERTVSRDWEAARLWLYRELNSE